MAVILLIALSAAGHADEIQVYKSSRVDRPYRVVGTVETGALPKSTRAMLIAELKHRAAGLGADAIMDVKFTERRSGGHGRRFICPKGKHECRSLPPDSRYVESASATAIQFKKKN